jgi:hypothetical protein
MSLTITKRSKTMCNNFDLSKITGNEEPIADPNECPVCNEVDDDGLEACAACYNSVIADAVLKTNELRFERNKACAELRVANETIDCLKKQIRQSIIELERMSQKEGA